MKKFLVFLLFLISYQNSYAWNFSGHKIIAEIAYQHLNSRAKHKVLKLVHVFSKQHNYTKTFMMLATWPDQLHRQHITLYNHWHYINKGFSYDGTHYRYANKYNVVWAIKQLQKNLAQPGDNLAEQARLLSFYSHFVGDVHQPLHCANLFSHHFTKGDKGGNLFLIKSNIAKNLHQFWDNGLGWFNQFGVDNHLSFHQVIKAAKKIQQDYPESYFPESKLQDINPSDWAQESFKLAKNKAYLIKQNTKPSKKYITTGQQIVEKRLALAGYRLAYGLNQLYK